MIKNVIINKKYKKDETISFPVLRMWDGTNSKGYVVLFTDYEEGFCVKGSGCVEISRNKERFFNVNSFSWVKVEGSVEFIN